MRIDPHPIHEDALVFRVHRHRLIARSALALAFALTPAASLFGQTQTRESRTRTPEHPSGITAAAPIPVELHQRNTGGSDGAGLCVIASAKTAGAYLGWTAELQALWDEAKRRPGGYYDGKFDQLARDAAPGLRYAHYHGSNYEVLKRLSELGVPFGVTMDTGDLYGGQRISHMVTGAHFDDQWTCHIDNNSPGLFTWTTRSEWERRSKLGSGEFWLLAIAPTQEWLAERDAEGIVQAVLFAVLAGVAAGFAFTRIRRASFS